MEDVGHTLVVGPTGAGKTSLIALATAQALRYGGQVFNFDKKKGLYTLTRCLGGTFIELSPENEDERLCPLAAIDTDEERAWA